MSTAPVPAKPPVAIDRADQTFVGRRKELAAIRASLDVAANGNGRLDVVSGPAGIGKTRLTHEVAAIARERGFYVVRGGCWEGEGAPAYWPWSDVLRNHLGTAAGPMGAAADFSQLLEIAADQAGIPVRGEIDATKEAQQARFMLFDRFCELLAALALAQPMLVILDDVQFADTGSLLLLQFLAARLSKTAIALLVTSRDPLSELTASTTRHPWARHRVLSGLSRSEARTLLAAYVSAAPRRSDLDRLMHLTEGNPYFVKEVGHLLADGTRLWDRTEPIVWPASLLAVTLQPYHRLSAHCRALLEAASVVGREFDAEVTAHAARIPVPDALALLDEAVQHRVVATLAPGRYHFVHALVREAVHDQLHPSHRTRLHESVGEIIALQANRGTAVSAAALAHHFCNALPLTNRRQAAQYCIAAGTSARDAFGFEEAVLQFRRAQDISGTSLTELEQCDLLLHLGAAEAAAGEWVRSRSTFEDAAAIARRVDCPIRLARAALGFKGMMWATNPVDMDAVDLLEEAHLRLGEKNPDLQVEVLSVLSRFLYFSTDGSRARHYGNLAIALASQTRDDRLRAIALEAHTVTLLQPGRAAALLDTAATLIEVGDRLRDAHLRFNARIFRQFGLLTVGRLKDADEELELIAQITTSHPHPRFKWQLALLRAARATLRGQLNVATRLSTIAQDLGTRVHDYGPLQYHLMQAFQQAQLRNDMGFWTTGLRALETLPDIPALRVGHAWLLARSHHIELAAEALHSLAENSFQLVPPSFMSLWLLSLLADVAEMVQDERHARTLYHKLRPHAPEFIVAGWGTLIDGSVSHYLGVLAHFLGMHEAAHNHFETAISANRRIGAPALTARSALALARHLLAVGTPAGFGYARELARKAAGTFASLDLAEYSQQAETICRQTDTRTLPTPAQATPTINTFRREGDFWTISYKGRTTRLRATLGLHYLAVLLSRPDTPVHVLELITSQGHTTGGTVDLASDTTARNAYKRRMNDITSELEEAEVNNDLGRQQHLREEREHLLSELSRSFSATGAPRPYRSDTEKARISVRNRISAALQHLRRCDSACAEFIQRSLKTGTLCVYSPIEPTVWSI